MDIDIDWNREIVGRESNGGFSICRGFGSYCVLTPSLGLLNRRGFPLLQPSGVDLAEVLTKRIKLR